MTCFLQLSFDTLRDEELPLSQEYAPPVRTGQPEMREPIIYHQLTKEAVKKRKLISVPAYEVPDKRAPAANQAPVQEAPSVKQAPAHGAPVNPNPADGRKIIQTADTVKQVKKTSIIFTKFCDIVFSVRYTCWAVPQLFILVDLLPWQFCFTFATFGHTNYLSF